MVLSARRLFESCDTSETEETDANEDLSEAAPSEAFAWMEEV